MGEMMLPVEFMKLGYIFIPVFLVLFVMEMFVKIQYVKMILLFLKALAYGGLAFLMWKFYQGKPQIDIISAFTFIFCCFEASDNLLSLIYIPINEYRHSEERMKDKMDLFDIMNRYRK